MVRVLDSIHGPKNLRNLDIKSMTKLCEEIREKITETISENGGHLASNLGVVELTVALHSVFKSPHDHIIWDVGHQCYPHKILTGRHDLFSTIRSKGGLSGFPKPDESLHDQFGVGHASTSLSAASGFAVSRDLAGKTNHVVAVIGDGALTGGMALEALNHIGYMGSRLIIILNDNKMSISPNVGALSKYTSRISKTRIYKTIRNQIKNLEKEVAPEKLTHLKEGLKHAGSPNFLFEKIGVEYIGPLDGHNLRELMTSFEKAKSYTGPVLVHVKTVKGKGYLHAEKDSSKFHGIGRFDKTNGKTVRCVGCTYTDVFGEALVRLAEKDKRIVAITAAMATGTGLEEFRKRFPDRFFDVGIAEQHAVTFAAGLAKKGLLPVFAVYSTFLQRAYDQIVHDVALQNLPVIFAIDRAGLVGEDGPTHHGAFDLSYLRHIPNLAIAAPKDRNELIQLLSNAVIWNRPLAIRYPKESPVSEILSFDRTSFELPSSELLIPGKKAVIVAVGSMVKPALDAAHRMNKGSPHKIGVINARFIKPIDPRVMRYIKKIGNAIIIEENAVKGGFGSMILEEAAGKFRTKIRIKGIPDRFISHGTRQETLHEAGLTTAEIEKEVRASLR